MMYENYAKQTLWLQQRYASKSFSSSSITNQQKYDSPWVETLPSKECKQTRFSGQEPVRRLAKFPCDNVGKIILLALLSQVTAGQVLETNTTLKTSLYSMSSADTDKVPQFPALDLDPPIFPFRNSKDHVKGIPDAERDLQSGICLVANIELLELKNVLLNVSQEMSMSYENNSFESNDANNISGSSNSCAQLISDTKHSINYIVKELNFNKHLADIIKGAYANKLENFETIVEFARILPIGQQATAYRALFEEMKKNRHLSIPNGLLFSDVVKEIFSGNNNYSYSEFSVLTDGLEMHVDNITTTWANSIRNGECDQVRSYAKQSIRTVSADTLNRYLPEIIKKTYAKDLDNFENILKCVSELPLFYMITGYEAMFDVMNRSNDLETSELIRLAYKVKQVTNINESTHELKMRYQNLKNNFPAAIKELIWHEKCCIKNVNWKEFLYAAGNDFKLGNGDRQIFTWIPTDWVPGDAPSEGDWKLEPVDNAKYFNIKNKYWDQYLRAGTNTFGPKRRHVLSYEARLLPKDKWKIEPTNRGSSTQFYIKNVQKNEYLLASEYKYDDDRRRVFTWRPGDRIHNGIWALNCR